MNICICSSDKNLADKLISFLKSFFCEKDTHFNTTHTYSLDNIKTNLFDVFFVDLNNIKTTRNIENTPTIYISDVIFYALNDIKHNSILLKPINYNSFNKEFSKLFLKYLDTNNKNKSFILKKIKSFSQKKDCTVENKNEVSQNNLKNINSSSIIYIESVNKNNSKVFTQKNVFEIDENIDYFDKKFSDSFFRCSKNYLINLNNISKIGKNFVIINDIKIDVDKNKFKELKNSIINFFKIEF